MNSLQLPDPDTCEHAKATHVHNKFNESGTLCLSCGKVWPDAADGTWTGPLKGKTP